MTKSDAEQVEPMKLYSIITMYFTASITMTLAVVYTVLVNMLSTMCIQVR